jgi:hypothetical protein
MSLDSDPSTLVLADDKPTDDKPTDDKPTSGADVRNLSDPRELRAVTHPVRLALIEVLGLNSALTATEAGELISESPTTCSFHLRQLAKYGFVEEAGTGPGRRRPWKLTHRAIQFSPASDDPDSIIAATALQDLLVRRWFERFDSWQRVRHTYSAEWQEASDLTEGIVYLTPAELIEAEKARMAVFDRFRSRDTDPSLRPGDARPVEVLSFAFPYRPSVR